MAASLLAAPLLGSCSDAPEPADHCTYGRDNNALSESAKRGEVLFFSERPECYHCHAGLNLTTTFQAESSRVSELNFENTGLYNLGSDGAYPAPNRGLYEQTARPADMGKFRVPTLRNIELTAPYMHDGSMATLDEVIDHYAAGGRLIEQGPNAGDGRKNPYKSPLVRGFTLTADERADLLAFLASLTDESFVQDSRFRDPWTPSTP